MQEFTFNPQGLKAIRKTSLLRALPVMIGSLLFIFIIRYVQHTNDLNYMLIYIPIILAVYGFSLYRGISRQTKLYTTFRILIDEHSVTREMEDTVPLSLHVFEIRTIVKKKNGNISIRGENSRDVIEIPAEIDRLPELEQALQHLKPFDSSEQQTFAEKFRAPVMLLATAMFLTVYLVNNKAVVLVCGVISVGIMIWNFISIQRSKNVTASRKKSSWIFLFTLACVLYIMYLKLSTNWLF